MSAQVVVLVLMMRGPGWVGAMLGDSYGVTRDDGGTSIGPRSFEVRTGWLLPLVSAASDVSLRATHCTWYMGTMSVASK